MIDVIGNPLVEGDIVVLRTPSYSSIAVGRVRTFTPQKVRVEYVNNWNYSHEGYRQEILVEPTTLCVVHGPQAQRTREKFERMFEAARM